MDSEFLLEVLERAESFVDLHSGDYYRLGQDLLRDIRKAIKMVKEEE